MHLRRFVALGVAVSSITAVTCAATAGASAPPNPITGFLGCGSDQPGADCGNHRITVVGDLDGDGRPDIVAEHDRQTIDGNYRHVYEGRRGTDGTVLWSYETGPLDFISQTVYPAVVGDPPASGVLLAWDNRTVLNNIAGFGGTSTAAYALHLVALNAAGREVWTRTILHNYDTLAGLNGYSGLVGTFHAISGTATDELVEITPLAVTPPFPAPQPPVERDLLVIDGRDGSVTSRATYQIPQNNVLKVTATRDLSGDTRDDLLVGIYPLHYNSQSGYAYPVGPGTVTALRGTDQSTVWSDSAVPGQLPSAVGDVSGDGHPDLAGAGFPAQGVGPYVLDGTTGQLVWSHVDTSQPASAYASDEAIDWGDIEGTGQQDIGDQVVRYVAGNFNAMQVTYSAYRPDGSAIYQTAYVQSGAIGSNGGSVGDANSDGVQDAVHRLITQNPAVSEQGVVDGRTGLKLWSGPAGTPIGASIDGNGNDLALVSSSGVTAQDGATGATIWSTAVTVSGEYETVGADLTGDGKAEVIVRQLYAEDSYISPAVTRPDNLVLDGATGQVLWGY